MDRQRSDECGQRFSEFLDELASVIGHAAETTPAGTRAQYRSLLHFLAKGAWSDAAVLGKVRDLVRPRIAQQGVIEAWALAYRARSSRLHPMPETRKCVNAVGLQGEAATVLVP